MTLTCRFCDRHADDLPARHISHVLRSFVSAVQHGGVSVVIQYYVHHFLVALMYTFFQNIQNNQITRFVSLIELSIKDVKK